MTYSTGRYLTQMNCDWTGKLQVILLSTERNCPRALFGGSNRDAFWASEGKIHERECVKEFFCKLTGWHLATSLQINFFTDSFQGF